MGWWSATIMGGDAPLDYQSYIYDWLGIDMFNELNKSGYSKIPKKKFEAEQDSLVKKLSKGSSSGIGLQVLGVMMMEAGAKISDKNKKLIIKAAEKDEWAKEDEGRKAHIDAFIKALESYDGKTPVKTTSEGLFEAFSKHTGGGLINKNVKQPK